jgi:hypothetical protein
MTRKLVMLVLLLITIQVAKAEEWYVNPNKGNDANPGTKTQPLKKLSEAAMRVNANKDRETTTLILSEGVYPLTETVLFINDKYTREKRLVIRAEYMPDDADWSPQRMPVVVTVAPLVPAIGGEEARGIQPEVSHVTIEGIRFSGSPDYTYVDGKNLRRSYPVWRDGKNLDDLIVTQCLFAGNVDVLPLHVGVIANGQGLVIDHCVFYNCKNPVVFWRAENGNSRGNAMRYCLVYGSYFSGVWTTQSTNGDDFEFHHNIIADCSTVWIRENGSTRHYTAHDCIFTGYVNIAAYGSGPLSGANVTSSDFLQMKNIQTVGHVEIEKDQSKRNYLQLTESSFGSALHAGLFTK